MEYAKERRAKEARIEKELLRIKSSNQLLQEQLLDIQKKDEQLNSQFHLQKEMIASTGSVKDLVEQKQVKINETYNSIKAVDADIADVNGKLTTANAEVSRLRNEFAMKQQRIFELQKRLGTRVTCSTTPVKRVKSKSALRERVKGNVNSNSMVTPSTDESLNLKKKAVKKLKMDMLRPLDQTESISSVTEPNTRSPISSIIKYSRLYAGLSKLPSSRDLLFNHEWRPISSRNSNICASKASEK